MRMIINRCADTSLLCTSTKGHVIVACINFMDSTFIIDNRVMLTSALRVLVNNPVKESFYGKRKKN